MERFGCEILEINADEKFILKFRNLHSYCSSLPNTKIAESRLLSLYLEHITCVNESLIFSLRVSIMLNVGARAGIGIWYVTDLRGNVTIAM